MSIGSMTSTISEFLDVVLESSGSVSLIEINDFSEFAMSLTVALFDAPSEQHIYWISKLLAPVVYFADLVIKSILSKFEFMFGSSYF